MAFSLALLEGSKMIQYFCWILARALNLLLVGLCFWMWTSIRLGHIGNLHCCCYTVARGRIQEQMKTCIHSYIASSQEASLWLLKPVHDPCLIKFWFVRLLGNTLRGPQYRWGGLYDSFLHLITVKSSFSLKIKKTQNHVGVYL